MDAENIASQGTAVTTTTQPQVISLVACGLDEDEAAMLRACLPADHHVPIAVYTRRETDANMLNDRSGPLILVAGHAHVQQNAADSRTTPWQSIIIVNEAAANPALADSSKVQFLRRPLGKKELSYALARAVDRLISTSQESAATLPAPIISPAHTDGVVVIDRHDHILFMDHHARKMTMPQIVRIIESININDCPPAGEDQGIVAVPDGDNAGMQLDARSVGYEDKILTVIRMLPLTDSENPQQREASRTDHATGLLNREALVQLLEEIIKSPGHARWTLVLLDLDRMKVLTEGIGRRASDHAVAVTAARLRTRCRQQDHIARIGNDEFAILVRGPGTDKHLEEMCRKWLDAIALPVMLSGNRPLHLTASAGSARIADAHGDVTRLLRQADIALTQARHAGGNEFRRYHPHMTDNLRYRWNMETRLRQAIEREQFTLEFQPLYRSGSNVIVAAESLLRWDDPTHGRVYPDQFIPLLEETGLIVPVGEWILRDACHRARAWQDACMPEFRISVNVSPVQVQAPGLTEAVRKALEQSGLAPEYLALEITEQLLLEHTDRALEVLTSITDLGVKLFLDDFGTGYASMSYLKRFPVCGIKIDRSFIESLPDGADDRAITLTILDLCRHLDLWAIPEGVETAAQAAFLTEHGATLQQGYFYSRPVPAPVFSTLLSENSRKPH